MRYLVGASVAFALVLLVCGGYSTGYPLHIFLENIKNLFTKIIIHVIISMQARNKEENKMAFDIYATITDKAIEQLENGVAPWRRPWFGVNGKGAVSHATGKSYSLLNQCLIGTEGEYATFNQIKNEGGKVRKGAKARMVVFYKMVERENKDTGEKELFPMLRYYNIFNILDAEDIAAKYEPELVQRNQIDACTDADAVIAAYIAREGCALTEWAGNHAYYNPANDRVTLPRREQFASAAEYYSAVFHELVHSTGTKERLARGVEKDTGKEDYGREELVAEIGAAALLNRFGIDTGAATENSAAYLATWAGRLKDDKRMIVYAAGRAAKAVAYITGDAETDEKDSPDEK